MIRAKWDKDARDKGLWEWDGQHHPDVGDAGSYAIPAYLETAPKPKEPSTDTEDQAAAKAAEAALKQRMEAAKHPAPAAPRVAAQLWNGRRVPRPGGW